MGYLEVGIRALIAVVFLVSSVGKVAGRGSFQAFVASLGELNLLPTGTERAVARLVVASEFAVWLLLVMPGERTTAAGLGVAIVLLAVFSVGIVCALRSGVRGSCRCFGTSSRPLGIGHVLRNTALLAVAAFGVCVVPSDPPVDSAGLLLAVFLGALVGGLVTVLEDLVDLFRPIRFRPIRAPGRDVAARTRR